MRRGFRVALLLGAIALAAALLVYVRSKGTSTPARQQEPPQVPSAQVREGSTSAVAVTSSAPSNASADPSPPPPGTEVPVRPATPEVYWRELELLERKDKKQALAYALLGEQWYPEQVGKLAEARSAKIVTLMAAVGQMAEARERTRRFIVQYPTSPYRPLVQGVTGIHPRPGAPPQRK